MEILLADLVKAIKSNKPHLDQVDLPIFHPATDDVNNWLQQVEGIKGELEWSDVDVLVKVGLTMRAGGLTIGHPICEIGARLKEIFPMLFHPGVI
jgi:hypothetical protein